MFLKLNSVKNNYGNAQKVLQSVHKKEDIPLLSTTSDTVSITDTSQGASMSTSRKKKITLESHGFTTADWDDAHLLMYRFFNSAGVAQRQADNPYLKKFQTFLIDNASALASKSKKKEANFSRYKYTKYQYQDFHKFLTTVQQLVQYTRTYYQNKLKQDAVPFVYVGHDGWDSSDYNVLGVSVRFVVPTLWINVNFALGLQRHDNKTAQGILEKVVMILKR